MILATVLVLLLSAALLAAFLGGAVLCIGGLRGIRVDDHPLCRRCGYDLVGHAERPARCPECGSNTQAPLAVVLGNREVDRGRLLAGVSLIVLSSMPLALSGCYDTPREMAACASGAGSSMPTATVVAR